MITLVFLNFKGKDIYNYNNRALIMWLRMSQIEKVYIIHLQYIIDVCESLCILNRVHFHFSDLVC